jgi:hypothetical protein
LAVGATEAFVRVVGVLTHPQTTPTFPVFSTSKLGISIGGVA